MNFQELDYVLAIDKYKSYSKAAEKLFITQSALNKYIKNLENQLNVKLFYYQDRKVSATPAGKRYIEAACSMIRLYDKMNLEINASDEELEGELKIGLSLQAGSYFLPRILPQFKKQFPRIKVLLFEEYADSLEKKLKNGQLDIYIVNQPEPCSGIAYITLCQVHLCFMISRNHKFAGQFDSVSDRHITADGIRAFSDERFLLFTSNQRNRKIEDTLLKEADITPKQILELRNPYTMNTLCARGVGVGFIPSYYADFRNPLSPLYLSVDHPSCYYPLVAGYSRKIHQTKYAKVFLEILKKSYLGKNGDHYE